MVFIHVYHSKAWLVDDHRDPALETNITTTVKGAATWDPLFEPDPIMDLIRDGASFEFDDVTAYANKVEIKRLDPVKMYLARSEITVVLILYICTETFERLVPSTRQDRRVM